MFGFGLKWLRDPSPQPVMQTYHPCWVGPELLAHQGRKSLKLLCFYHQRNDYEDSWLMGYQRSATHLTMGLLP